MTHKATVLSYNPLRYWRLGESSGSTAYDLGSQGQNGTLHGGITLSVPGLLYQDIDTAMLFDGSTGYISFADTGMLTGAGSWSIEMLVKLSSLSGYPTLFYYGSTATNAGVVFWINSSNNTINIGFQNAGNLQGPVVATSITYHLIAVYDGSALHLYVNGDQSGSVTTTGAVTLNSGSIGSQLGSANFTAAVFDEVAFYGSALSASAALSLYKSTVYALLPHGPIGAWQLAFEDEFDDSAGMSGSTNGLAASKWNCGWYSGPSSPGVGNTTAITDPINTSSPNTIAYFGPASIVFPGDSAVHLRLQAGVDNGGTYNTRTVESGTITTAGLMALNPAAVPVSTSNPDLRPYTINGPCVLEIRARVPGPNASATNYWPGIFLTNSGNYGGTNPSGYFWPGQQNYLEEIDLVEMNGGGSLGSSSSFNLHAASSYGPGAGSGITSGLQSTDLSLAYHTYTYLFLPNAITIWIDGVLVTNVTPTAAQMAAQWQYPQYLLIDFQAYASAIYPTTATGTPSDYMIDYVRVWRAPAGHNAVVSTGAASVESTQLSAKSLVGKRGELAVTVYDPTGTLHIQQYQRISVQDGNGVLVFSGYVTSPQEQKPGFQALLETQLTAIDQHWLADKRIVAKLYRNQTCGSMVNDILTNILSAEGVSVGQIASATVVPIANFGYVSVADALNALAVAASASGNPYYWMIDQNKLLWFVAYATVAGATVDGTQIDDGRLSGQVPKVTRANPAYRNTQYATGGVAQTGTLTEIQAGDGQKRAFAMNYALASAPTITINTGSGYVSQTVGWKGQTGYQWYWALNDTIVTQDNSGTVLATTGLLKVVYVGQYPSVFKAQIAAQVTAQAALDGTSGIVEATINDNTIATADEGLAECNQLLSQYGIPASQFVFATRSPGFAPGQLITVNYAPYGFSNAQMLVGEVDATDQRDGVTIWYIITAIIGPYDTTWVEFFGNILKPHVVATNINLGVTLNSPLAPSTTLQPSTTLAPG